jgi:competence protein ComEC
MVLPILLFALGVWLLQLQPVLPPLVWAGWLTACPFLLALLQGGGRLRRILRMAVILIAALAFGFAWAAWMAHVRMADALPADWEGRDITLVGVVATLPQQYERSVRFEFNVEQLQTPDAQLPQRIVLSWWGAGGRDGARAQLPEVHPGERWQFTVRLKRPHGLVNPHGFDYEAWLLERGVRATGYVRARGGHRRLQAQVQSPAYAVERTRERLRDRIQSALGEAPAAGVITALVMGDQRAIPPEQWQVFTRTGVNHLMSISGLHVTMLSGLAFALVNFAWRSSARLTLALPAVKAAAVAGLLAALFYALLAGFAVPAQRTVFMLAVVAVALWMGRATAAREVLALALLVVLLIDPWSVLAAGFWLSFGAVAIILFVTSGRLKPAHWLMAWARVQWAVTLALVPVLLALFQQISLISPVANALAIPLVSLVVVPLALAGAVLPFDAILQFSQWLMNGCVLALEWLSVLPDAAWEQHAPPGWTVAVALIGTVWMLLPRGFPARWIGAIAFLPLLLIAPDPPPDGGLRLTVLDVGQGLSVVAQTRSHALLFDTGPAFGPSADSGNRVIVPFLRASGIRRLDALVLSHDDIDHTGGALSVLQAVPVEAMLSSLPDLDPLLLVGPVERRCAAGQAWRWDGVQFEMLYPDADTRNTVKLKDNERSCVLKITTASGSVLIPADIERHGERTLLATAAGQLRADVLIAPHQGSRTSSSEAFVRAVAPQTVIFPIGYRNAFRHPHPEVVERYRQLGSAAHYTDRHGAVMLKFGDDGIKVLRQREIRHRYWLDPPDPGAGGDDSAMLW